MKIRMTFEFDEQCRRALAGHYGQKGLASRKDFEAWIELMVTATMEEITVTADTNKEEDKENP